MTLPASVSTGIVEGTWVGSDGEPCTGCVTFTASVLTVRVATDGAVVHLQATDVDLDENGSISETLVATDDVDTDPTGFTWSAHVDLDDSVGYTVGPFALAGGTTVNLADV